MILYCKGLNNSKIDALSQRANYFKEKKQFKYLILRTNKDGTFMCNYMILAVTFRAENNTFAERL